ncbi:MAG: DUF4403 family protein [Granulosicoccus sp.]
MPRYYHLARSLTASLMMGVILVSSCTREKGVSQVSEQPATTKNAPATLTQERPGTFALRARVRFEDIEALAAQQIPARYPVTGSKRVCKRIIGIKACGTANWNLTVNRAGKLQIKGDEGIVYISTPIGFDGVLGIQGSVAKALGLNALDVSGRTRTLIALSLNMGADWCPEVRADVSYEWTKKPTLVYSGALDFSLESVVNDALDKQLATLESRLNESIDCDAFNEQLSRYWRSYTFPLEIPASAQNGDAEQLHLNIVPTDFAFSGLRTEDEKLGVSFSLSATTVVESNPEPESELTLPPLKQVTFADSRTDFDLVLRARYSQLETLIRPRLIDKTFSTESAAGPVSVTVTSFKLSGNAQDVTVSIGFSAKLPGSRNDTKGLVYLQASPVVDTENEKLILDNIRLSRVLDSTLWNLISRVFEGQIIAQLERNSELDLAPRLRNLEQSLTAQLQDPERTAGLQVRATGLSIQIMEIVAEENTLAARARVATELDIDIPLSVIQKPLQ